MKGVIDKIWENKTKGNKPYWVLSIGGENYSVWNKKYMEGIQEGSTVEYEWKASGDFRKVTGIKKIEMLPNPGNEQNNSRDQRIVRMSCIKSAVTLVANFEAAPGEKGEITLGIARKFEKYVTESGEKSENEDGK